MSSQPLMRDDEEESPGVAKRCCKHGAAFGITVVVVFIVALIGNIAVYYMFTLGCGPKAIGEHYAFPGGGESEFGGPSYNLLPQRALASERTHNIWGMPLDILPANEAGAVAGAQVGTWWRNKGIIFYTYTYEDISNSKLTLYMRRNWWLPWMSYKMARCDGKGPVVTFSERGSWVKNKVRRFLRMNQAQSFSIIFDDEIVADVQDVQNGFPSLTVSNPSDGKESASSILTTRHYHGNKDQWYINNHKGDSMPYWVTTAISLPFAFREIDLKIAGEADAGAKNEPVADSDSHPSFLAEQAPGLAKEESPIADVETSKLAAEPNKIV